MNKVYYLRLPTSLVDRYTSRSNKYTDICIVKFNEIITSECKVENCIRDCIKLENVNPRFIFINNDPYKCYSTVVHPNCDPLYNKIYKKSIYGKFCIGGYNAELNLCLKNKDTKSIIGILKEMMSEYRHDHCYYKPKNEICLTCKRKYIQNYYNGVCAACYSIIENNNGRRTYLENYNINDIILEPKIIKNKKVIILTQKEKEKENVKIDE